MNEHRENRHARLPVTFHRTFYPERTYLNAIIRFAASEGEGSDQQISLATGIPVGKSDGKVPAIVAYAQGMGLLASRRGSESGARKLSLTDFGRAVLLEDPFLSTELTQWMGHAHLCRAIGGAEVWHQVFAQGADTLGHQFVEDRVEEYLVKRLGKRNRSLTGPLLRMYTERTSFCGSEIVVQNGALYQRNSAPCLRTYKMPYSAFFLMLWEDHFDDTVQLSLADFENETLWSHLFGWAPKEVEIVLSMLQSAGAIRLDTHIWPYAIMKTDSSKNYWARMYDDLP